METNIQPNGDALPRYQCHKQVYALKIASVYEDHLSPEYPIALHFEDPSYKPRRVRNQWYKDKKVESGGYLIIYDDGYASFSPADVFEAGYSKLAKPGKIPEVEFA